MINLDKKFPWGFSYSFNLMVDFCVWVLEIDGLRIPPFVQHSDGNKILQKADIKPEDWLLWLILVVKLQDQRLNWRVENLQALITETFTSVKLINSQQNQVIESLKEPSLIAKNLNWLDRQYQEAAVSIKQFSREEIPPNLWVGNPEVGKTLKKLWQHYLRELNKRDTQERQQAEQTENMENLWQELQSFRTRLPPLQIYQISYLAPVEYVIPPASIIVSIKNGLPGSQSFCQSILHTAKHLAAIQSH